MVAPLISQILIGLQEVLIAQHYTLAADEAHLFNLASNSRELI
jgi:hypothetical protein